MTGGPLAQTLLLNGEQNAAMIMVRQAWDVAERIMDKNRKAAILQDLSQNFPYFGKEEHTSTFIYETQLMAKIHLNEEEESTVSSGITQILSQVERYIQLLPIIEGIDDEANEEGVLDNTIQTLIDKGQTDQALSVATQIRNKERKILALGTIAQRLTQKGQRKQALQVIQTTLITAGLVGRESFFEALALGATTLSTIDQGQTLWDIYKSIVMIEKWWREK